LTEFGEIVGDEDAQTPFELLRDKNLRDEVSDLLEVLDDRERKIILLRFGLDGGKPKTLEDVGKKFGVTRERIRQLQNVALVKMRGALRKKETPTRPKPVIQLQPTTKRISLMKPQPTKNQQILLGSRPSGEATLDNFQLTETEIPKPGPGQILLRTIYLSLDPYMRGRMNAGPSYAPPVELGEVMGGQSVCEVVESNLPNYHPGDIVLAATGWQDFSPPVWRPSLSYSKVAVKIRLAVVQKFTSWYHRKGSLKNCTIAPT
jgi:hypothetical protein